jgi:uncharacterized protein (UPF0332 family)/predicted nucleotidyltransferase
MDEKKDIPEIKSLPNVSEIKKLSNYKSLINESLKDYNNYKSNIQIKSLENEKITNQKTINESSKDKKKAFTKNKENVLKKSDLKKFPSLNLVSERDIAMDFAQKLYLKFDKLIKAVVLFGSTAKRNNTIGSDVDIIIIIDDAIVKFDEKLILWYRENLGEILKLNPYREELHINTVKLSTWWTDLYMGDPTVINIIRYGDTLIDFGGFFSPLKIMLQEGRIKPTPEAIYTCLNRAPLHITRSKFAQISAIEGCYWSMVDSSQALLMAIKIIPPSPENIPILLKENFVDKKLLKMNSVIDFKELYDLHKKMMHGELHNIEGKTIDEWQYKAEQFFDTCIRLIKEILLS